MADLLSTLRQAGFRGPALDTMQAIVQAESRGNPRALNPKGRDLSYGLAQINMRGDLGPDRRQRFGLRSNEDLYDPLTNLRVAYALSNQGTNFAPWTTYTSGKYKQFLGKAQPDTAAAAQGTPSSPAAQPRINPDIAAYVQRAVGRKAGVKADPTDISAYVQRATGRRTSTDAHERTDAGSFIDTSTPRQGTHVTDGLDWNQGRKTATDIMAAPGTPVGAPEDGRVVRWGSAQGGEALYFQGASGRMYWLGHIDDRLPVGSRVRRGGLLARVSADHPAPHLHFDFKL